MDTKVETSTETTASAAPLAPGAPAKLSIEITDKAATMARKQLDKRGQGGMIRLGIRGAGCSGYTYVIEFEDGAPRDRDRVFEKDGVKFVVDKKSLLYLAGTILDWEQSLMQQGFKFRNPNEKSSCGCGHSFQI
jgi:iron-sulfur cluster assembly protein